MQASVSGVSPSAHLMSCGRLTRPPGDLHGFRLHSMHLPLVPGVATWAAPRAVQPGWRHGKAPSPAAAAAAEVSSSSSAAAVSPSSSSSSAVLFVFRFLQYFPTSSVVHDYSRALFSSQMGKKEQVVDTIHATVSKDRRSRADLMHDGAMREIFTWRVHVNCHTAVRVPLPARATPTSVGRTPPASQFPSCDSIAPLFGWMSHGTLAEEAVPRLLARCEKSFAFTSAADGQQGGPSSLVKPQA